MTTICLQWLQFSSAFPLRRMSSKEQNKRSARGKLNLEEKETVPNVHQCQHEKCSAVAAKKCIPCNKEFCLFHILVANHDHKRTPSRKCEFEGCKKSCQLQHFPVTVAKFSVLFIHQQRCMDADMITSMNRGRS